MSTESPATERNVTAFFGSREAAEGAVAHLVETGLPRERILLRTGAARTPGCVDNGKGLLQEVKELILPSEEPDAAVEALKHEGYLLSVRPDPDAHDAVFRMLEQDGGRGVESREDIWPDWKSGQTSSKSDDYPDSTADLDSGEVSADPGTGPSDDQDGGIDADAAPTREADPADRRVAKDRGASAPVAG